MRGTRPWQVSFRDFRFRVGFNRRTGSSKKPAVQLHGTVTFHLKPLGIDLHDVTFGSGRDPERGRRTLSKQPGPDRALLESANDRIEAVLRVPIPIPIPT